MGLLRCVYPRSLQWDRGRTREKGKGTRREKRTWNRNPSDGAWLGLSSGGQTRETETTRDIRGTVGTRRLSCGRDRGAVLIAREVAIYNMHYMSSL